MPDRQGVRDRGDRVWAVIAVAALWALAPFVVLAFLASRQTVGANPDQETWVPIASTGTEVSQNVVLGLEWTAASTVVAPDWLGTVTQVGVRPGSVVSSGDPILVVDGVQRLYWASDEAFYRPVCIGDSGSDVLLLNELLGELGFRHGSTTTMDWASRAGVRDLAASLGVSRPQSIQCFSPGWVVIGTDPTLTVAIVHAVLGAPAPGAGTDLLTGQEALEGIKFYEQVDGTSQSGDQIGGVAVGDDVLARSVLSVGMVSIGKASEVTSSPEAISAVAALVENGTPKVSGLLTWTLNESEYLVPASALVIEGDTACVFAKDSGGHVASVPAELLQSTPMGAAIRLQEGEWSAVLVSANSDGSGCG